MRHLRSYLKSLVALLFIAPVFVACSVEVQVEPLPVALLGETYSYTFDIDDNSWDWWGDNDMVLTLAAGELPDGVEIASSGRLYGTPEEVGNFHFKAGAYSIDEGWGDDEVDYDSEWFTLFVTERSTNDGCPGPNDSDATLYMCVGDIEAEADEDTGLSAGSEVTVDITYFVNFDDGIDYDITSITFTLFYDSTSFSLGDGVTGDDILREAATRQEATVDIDTSVAGQITVRVEAGIDQFMAGGRFADIPFVANLDLAPEEYNFSLRVDEMHSGSDQTLPTIHVINGAVTVVEE